MAEFSQQNQIISDRPEQKKRKPLFAVLVAVLILVLAFLLLCIIPGGHKVLAIVLPVPKGVPIVTSLNPIAFQEISPPVDGGSSLIIFPMSGASVTVPSGGGSGGLQPTFPPPDTDLTVNGSNDPIQISNGSSALLNWVTTNNPTSCGASGAWSGSKNPAGGSEETGPLFGPKRYKYKITCSNDYGSASDVSTVIVSGGAGDREKDKDKDRDRDKDGACVICPAPQTISSALSFSNNNLVSGVFPELSFTAPPEGGSVNISASISPPLGGSCLNLPGPFRVLLYDNNAVKFGGPGAEIYGTFGGWSGNFPEFFAEPGSAHIIKLIVQTNCAGGVIQSIVNFAEASLTAVGPSSAVCPLSTSSLPIAFSNNQLVSGSLPEYHFTAFDSELVKVNAFIAGYTGGPCLAPPYRVSLYDNDVLKFGPINASGSSWSDDFPNFTVAPGQHKIKLGIETNCAGSLNAPIQSLVSFPDVSMDVKVLNVPADAPQICPQELPFGLMDFGDAPDPPGGSFPSLKESNGARHINVKPFYLGKRVDRELDSHQVDGDSPNPAIGKDDGLDATIVVPGIAPGVSLWDLGVEIHNAQWPSDKPIYLNVLYDFNSNSQWDVPEEHIEIDKEFFVPTGESIFYSIPLLNTFGDNLNWLRLTVTDIKLGANYNGSWPEAFAYGETEDYAIDLCTQVHFVIPSRPHWIVPSKEQPVTVVGGASGFGCGEARPANVPGVTAVSVEGIPVNRALEPTRPGVPTFDPRFWEAIYDENGNIVRYHGVHDTNRTKEIIPPPVFIKIPEFGEPKRIKPIKIFTVKLPEQFQQAEALPPWLDSLLKFITASGDRLTLRESEASLNILKSLGLRPEARVEIRDIFRDVFLEVEKKVPVFISEPPKPVPTDGLIPKQLQSLPTPEFISRDLIRLTYQIKGGCIGDWLKCALEFLSYDGSGRLIDKSEITVAPNIFLQTTQNEVVGAAYTDVRVLGDEKKSEVLRISSAATITGGGTAGGSVTTGGGCAALSITTSSPLNQAQEGTLYPSPDGLQALTASGGTAPLTWSQPSGTFPPGLSLSSGGGISGTPDLGSAATYSFTIRVTDSCSPAQTNDGDFTLEVTRGI